MIQQIHSSVVDLRNINPNRHHVNKDEEKCIRLYRAAIQIHNMD